MPVVYKGLLFASWPVPILELRLPVFQDKHWLLNDQQLYNLNLDLENKQHFIYPQSPKKPKVSSILEERLTFFHQWSQFFLHYTLLFWVATRREFLRREKQFMDKFCIPELFISPICAPSLCSGFLCVFFNFRYAFINGFGQWIKEAFGFH